MLKINKVTILILSIFALIVVASIANAVSSPTVTFSSPEYTVNENDGAVMLDIHLSNVASSDVVVSYTTNDNTAIAGKNYTAVTSSVTIPAGSRDAPITVNILDNNLYDVNRTFFVNITAATGGSIPAGANATVTILEDEPAPLVIFTANTASVNEGSTAYLSMVKVSNGDGQFIPWGVAVNETTHLVYIADYYNHRIQAFNSDGSFAFKFGAYGSGAGQLTYPYGLAISQTTGNVYVTDASGHVKVFDKNGVFLSQFPATLVNPRGIAINPNNGNVYVVDNGGINEFTASGTYVASRSAYYYPITGEYITLYSLTGVAIKSNGDVLVTDTNSNLIKEFDANLNYVTQFSSDVLAVKAPQGIAMRSGDYSYAVDNQNFRVVAYNTLDQTIGSSWNFGSYGRAPGQFINPFMIAIDNNLHRIYVTDPGLARVTAFGFDGQPVTSWGGPFSVVPSSVNYTTWDGTAIAGKNYTYRNVTVTFQPDQYYATASLPTIAVPLYKPDTYFYANLTKPVNAQPGDVFSNATIWIRNQYNQYTVQFSANSYNVIEENDTKIYLTLNDIMTTPVTVTLGTTDGTAVRGTDYDYTVNTVTFDPGETVKQFTIPTLDDGIYGSPTKTFTVKILGIDNSQAKAGSRSSATVNILDNGEIPVIQFDSANYTASEAAGFATLKITINQSFTLPFNVSYQTYNGTALAGINFVNTTGNATFLAGEHEKTITIPLLNDNVYSVPGKAFSVVITGCNRTPFTYGLNRSANVTIQEGSPMPALQFNVSAYTVNENAGTVTINVTRNGATNQPVSIGYYTVDGTAKSALPNNNYTATSGTLTFQPGDLYKTFTVPVRNWPGFGPGVTFNVSLRNPVNATIGTPDNATVTIVNVDAAPTVSFSASAYPVYYNSGSVTLTVVLAGQTAAMTYVDFATYDGTAVASQDYTGMSGTMVFLPGETTKTITVPVTTVSPGYHPDKAFTVTLSNPRNATVVTPGTATVTIRSQTAIPTVAFQMASYIVNEPAGTGTASATFNVVMSDITTGPVTVNVATNDYTTVAGTNYVAYSAPITFAQGETQKQITITLKGDGVYSTPDKIFFLNLSGITGNAVLGSSPNAVVTIHESSPQAYVQFNASSYSVYENQTYAVVNVTLTAPLATDVTVNYATNDGTAKQGVNYTSQASALTFLPGETWKLIQVPITDSNGYYTNPMFFYVNITSVSANVNLGTPNVANVSVLCDDVAYTINLVQGWNFISSPVVIKPFMVSTIQTMVPQITQVMRYNNSTLQYQSYLIGISPARYDFSFQNDNGYLVYCNGAATITFVGDWPIDRSAGLSNTWNMVGWSTFNSSNAFLISNSITGQQQVMMFDASTQTYHSYIEGISPARYNFTMSAGSGYLISSDTVTSLNYGGI